MCGPAVATQDRLPFDLYLLQVVQLGHHKGGQNKPQLGLFHVKEMSS